MSSLDLEALLMEIQVERGLTNQNVVDAARPKDHPLHPKFEWDDKVGGEQYRLIQAGHLIRSVKTLFIAPAENALNQEPVTTRTFHSVKIVDDTITRREYMPIGMIATDEDMRAAVLAEAEREWRKLLSKYRHLTDFLRLVQADVSAEQ